MAQSEASDVGMILTPAHRVYLSLLGALGAGLMVATYLYDWGYWGWFGGGFFLVAGPGSLLVNHFKVGWQPAIGPCPSCGESLHFLTKKQYVRCVNCATLLSVEGSRLGTVSGEIISDRPELPAPFLERGSFPHACALCGGPPGATETATFERDNRKAGLPLGPILVTITKFSVTYPVCAEHVGQRAVGLGHGDHPSTSHPETHVSILFRSLTGLDAYRAHNASAMPPIRNEPQMPHAPGLSPR